MREGEKFRPEGRDVYLKKPWAVDSGAVQAISFLEVTMRKKT